MILYLTGANTSLRKSSEAPQTDTAKSLGGYVSSTPVPSGELNALFDLISAYTLEKKPRETIAVALINKLTQPIKDVTLKIVVEKDNIATFKVAAVALSESLSMEHIANRYAEPMAAEFHKVDFQRASVDIEILNPASVGEEIALMPFDIQFEVEESGIEGTWNAFENAFSNDYNYEIKRLSEKVFRIVRRDESVVPEPITCSYVTTRGFNATFLGKLKNGVTNEAVLLDGEDILLPESGIGLWIQRDLKSYKYPSNERLIEDFKNRVEKQEIETAELIISYNLAERNNYNEDYNQADYS